MSNNKISKTVIYSISGLLGIFSIIIFWLSLSGNKGDFEDMGETTGTMIAILLGFEMILCIAIQSLKRKFIPQMIKKSFVTITKYLREYHNCVCALAGSVLLLHIGFTLDLTNLWTEHLITGYITTALIVTAVFIGLFYKSKRKTIGRLHIILAVAAVVPFLLHIG